MAGADHQLKRWSTVFLIATIAAPILFFGVPLAVFIIQGWSPSCPGRDLRYETGEHFGFRIGMSRGEVVSVLRRERPNLLEKANALYVYYPPTNERARRGLYPKSWDQLSKVDRPTEDWFIHRRASLCLWHEKNTVLRFTDEVVTAIEDHTAYDGPDL